MTTRRIACITLDMEPDHGDSNKHIRLLENPEFLEQYTSIINKYNAKVTMFTVTSLFDSYGDDFKKLAEQIPLEYAVHSHSHDPHNACGLDEVQASTAAFQRFTGQKALGYRAPIGQIDRAGLGHLLDFGFAYDASVYTSIRPGKFGYFNLHMPNTPFRVMRGNDALIEFPFTSISTVRIVFALSYAKLLGWGLYSTLLKIFGLPDIALLLSHPHDFYFYLLADGVSGLEKFALARNAKRSFEYFDKMIAHLRSQGYQFMFVSELYREIKETELPVRTLETWK
jgi:peptidoglycan/xylan/chitin deacetylase (PgdA/CDA1 family)